VTTGGVIRAGKESFSLVVNVKTERENITGGKRILFRNASTAMMVFVCGKMNN